MSLKYLHQYSMYNMTLIKSCLIKIESQKASTTILRYHLLKLNFSLLIFKNKKQI